VGPPVSARRRVLAGLVLVVLILFAEAVFTDRVFYYRDIHSYWYQAVENTVAAIAQGAWPVWNPYAAFGGPMLEEPAYQIAYPFAWLNLLMPPAAYYKALVLTHAFGSALACFGLARALGLGRLAAFAGAAVWTCSGPFLSTVSMTHHFAGAAWIPCVLFAFERALARGTLASALGLGSAAAGQILAGSGDMCIMTALLGGILLLSRLGRRSSLRWPRVASVLAGALAVALSLSAVQWLPALAVLGVGSRLRMPPEANLYWSVHPLSLLDVLVPGLVAEFPMTTDVQSALFESREPFLSSLYLGVPALVLAGFALLGARHLLPLGGGLLFFLLAGLGRYTPFHALLLELPGFSLLRYPVKYFVPAALLCALLAAAGIDAARLRETDEARRRLRWAAAAAFSFACLALLAAAAADAARPQLSSLVRSESGPGARGADELLLPTRARLLTAGAGSLVTALLLGVRRSGLVERWTSALAALVILDVLAAGRGVNQLAPKELLTHRPPILDGVGAESRVYVFPYTSAWLAQQLTRGPADWEGEWRWALGLQEMLSPPIAARFRMRGSYDGDFTGLASPMLALLSSLVASEEPRPLGIRLLQIGGVDYVIALHARAFAGLPEVARAESVFAPPIRLFRVPGSLPRVYAVSGARAAPPAEAVALIGNAALDPTREVVLAPPAAPRPPVPGFGAAVRELWRRSDGEEHEVDVSDPGYLVILDAYHPGWRAYVDGAPAEILRANVLFRAVAVPGGRHRVRFLYRPATALPAALVSACAAVGVAAWAAARAQRSRHA
jgi:hypothetical protein